MRHALIMAALWAAPGATLLADADAVMENMLDIYTNTTNPQILETQRRGGLTLGRISARTAITSPNIINFQPPSIRGGCSGIDLYGGSFSFINKDEMTQALRAIASNAVSYAFTLAMESVCPSCMQKMENLRDQVDEINAMVRDSCYWATSLVDSTGLKAMRDERIAAAKGDQTAAGTVEDAAEAELEADSLHELETSIGAAQPLNVVWSVLQGGNLDTWFGAAGDDELLEVIMSLTGTLLKTEALPGGAQCTDDRAVREYCYIDLVSLLTVDEFVDGGGDVLVYRCGADPACLDPTPTIDPDWEGFTERVALILFGAPGLNDGLLFKLQQGNVALTPDEEAFLTSAIGPVEDILESASLAGGTLVSLGAQVQDTVASVLARQLVLELIFLVERAFAIAEVEMSPAMQDRLAGRQAEFAARNEATLLDLQLVQTMIDLRNQIRQDLARSEEAPALN